MSPRVLIKKKLQEFECSHRPGVALKIIGCKNNFKANTPCPLIRGQRHNYSGETQ
jgi:hypothetical protein